MFPLIYRNRDKIKWQPCEVKTQFSASSAFPTAPTGSSTTSGVLLQWGSVWFFSTEGQSCLPVEPSPQQEGSWRETQTHGAAGRQSSSKQACGEGRRSIQAFCPFHPQTQHSVSYFFYFLSEALHVWYIHHSTPGCVGLQVLWSHTG